MSISLATGPAAQTGLLDLERELLCSICTETLYQPLTLLDCLHTFCGSCLKEWFNFEYNKSRHSSSSTSRSNPYTCPTCRAHVKDARYNATVNTLLDMFLGANPGRGKSEQDKEDISKSYKPGENILPMLDHSGGRRSRRRHEEDGTEDFERSQLEEVRERSIREVRGTAAQLGTRLTAPLSDRTSSRSRSRDSRAARSRDDQRREERRARMRRVEAAEAQSRQRETTDYALPVAVPSVSLTADNVMSVRPAPPPTSPRHPSAVEARQRDRQVVPQTSLRSLMGSSESGAGTGDSVEAEQILQQIIEEGLLEGIDLHNLDPAQEDALSERVAEAYRQRHRNRGEPSSRLLPSEGRRRENESSRPRTRDRERQVSAEGRNHQRSQSAHGLSGIETRRPQDSPHRGPPPTRTGLLDAGATTRTHQRRSSEHERSQTSSLLMPELEQNQASRSATDLSDRHRTPENVRVATSRIPSNTRRTNTEPQPFMNASERWWRNAQAESPRSSSSHFSRSAEQAYVPPQNQSAVISTRAASRPRSANRVEAVVSSRGPRATLLQSTSSPIPTPFSSLPQSYPDPFHRSLSAPCTPSISCASCSRADIQHEVHKVCAKCTSSFCLRCYRNVPSIAFGCSPNHGPGSAHNNSAAASPSMDEAHTLTSRKYLRSDHIEGVVPSNADSTSHPSSSNDASVRLQEGKFCDLCHSSANHCYWSCDTCNKGDWGFCNSCINCHHCCTHPLLPLAHKLHVPKMPTLQQGQNADSGVITLTPSNLHAELLPKSTSRSPASTSSSSPAAASADPDYLPLTFTANCDICTRPIPPSNTRFHCPTHPNPNDPRSDRKKANLNKVGDYDICTSCYLGMVQTRQIRRDDGPHGWRKCPQGHRMIVIGFEDGPEGQKRVVVNDLVGGHWLRDVDPSSSTTATATTNVITPPSSSSGRSSGTGQWSWLSNTDDGTMKRESRVSRVRQHSVTTATASSTTSTTTNISNTSSNNNNNNTNTAPSFSFPADGGTGMRAIAIHPWYPEDGDAGAGELLFPRWAEIREVEDVNGDWYAGVYAGVGGVFPGGCVRVIQGHG